MNDLECNWCFEKISNKSYTDPENDLIFCGYVCARSFQEFESQFDVSDSSGDDE